MAFNNIKFSDGNEFIYYNDDTEHYPGCETCDYGSEYINNIYIETTNYKVDIVFNQMYEYAFSTSDAIRIFATVKLSDMTEREFIDHLEYSFRGMDGLQEFTYKRKVR